MTQDAALDTSTIRWVTERLHRNPYLVQDAGVRDCLQAAFAPNCPSAGRCSCWNRRCRGHRQPRPGRRDHTRPRAPGRRRRRSRSRGIPQLHRRSGPADAGPRFPRRRGPQERRPRRRPAGREPAGAGSSPPTSATSSCSAPPPRWPRERTGPRDHLPPCRHAAVRLGSGGPGLCLRAGRPDQPPSPAEAGELLSGEFSLPVWEIPDTAEAFIDLIRRARVIDPEIIRLAERLQTRINPPDPIDRTLLELVATTGLLRKAVRQPGDAGLAREVPRAMLALLAAWPSPGPPRDAAVDALLTLLVAPSRIEQADTSQQAELHELAVSGDSGLIAAFAERAGQSLTGELIGSPQLHANCFIMWRLEYGRSGDRYGPLPGQPHERPAGPRRPQDGRHVQADDLGIIEKVTPGLGNEWLQLTQPRGPMTRLPWSRSGTGGRSEPGAMTGREAGRETGRCR